MAIWCALASSLQAQTNLVYNGDFEMYDTCPISVSTPWDHQLERCLGWTIPTYATSDYFNACAGSGGGVGVPLNTCGYQIPHSGNAYCGIGIWQTAEWWFEYIQGSTVVPLNAGRTYHIEFYISNSYCFPYAVDQIGLYLSPNPISRPDPLPFNNIMPQLTTDQVLYIVDSLNWIKVEGLYTATGGEQFVTIGRFVDTANMYFFPVEVDTLGSAIGTYLYIDDVRITLVESELNVPNVFSPNADGTNDVFNITTVNVVDLTCTIYDRWGRLVATLNSPDESWDGSFSGSPCTEGTYFYHCSAIGNDNVIYNKKGIVQLMR
jgi:gliding motility-associated-like protein